MSALEQAAAAPAIMATSMQPVVDAIGFDLSIQFVSWFGGITVRLPADPQPQDVVSRAIGVEAARRLAAALGPGSLWVPRCTLWMLSRRNEEIVARRLAGATYDDLALAFNLTDRQVRRILAAEQKDAPPQRPTPISAEEGAAP